MTAGTHPLAEVQQGEIRKLIAAFNAHRKKLAEQARAARAASNALLAQYADYGLNDMAQWTEASK
ncbi:hypothetical protein KV557_24755 [Kitasatospora aureofaciens]|uniref:hypothetical protein n=1 Tax=Kitasatospora aureofaciens TaxID=1894 RepID=UPI001C49603C|nr:hypothetical protein [Kitasatospora aureofaciens]MBV6700276.1 hypothetical protein [Kitasatospora aureofaciens]